MNPAQPSMHTRSATHRVAASFEPGSSARCATSAKITRSTASASSRRPAAARRTAAPIPSRSQSRSSIHAPPSRRESSTSTSAARRGGHRLPGSRNREIDATSRASAARSTCPPGRSCGSPSRPGCRSPGAARCAPAAGTPPPSRPGSSAASPAGTRLHDTTGIPARTRDTPGNVCLQAFGLQAASHASHLQRCRTGSSNASRCSTSSARSPTRRRTAASAEDAFDVVVPSMPGYGFSGQAERPPAGTRSTSRDAWIALDEAPRATRDSSPRAATGARRSRT